MCIAQVRKDSWDEVPDIPRLAEFAAALEKSNRLVEVSFAEVEIPETAIRSEDAQGLIHSLRNPYRFLPLDDPLGEVSTLGKHVDQPEPGDNRGQRHLAEA